MSGPPDRRGGDPPTPGKAAPQNFEPRHEGTPPECEEAADAAAQLAAGWRDRLAEGIARHQARKAAQRAFRADHERRRQYAHPKRHAAKTRR